MSLFSFTAPDGKTFEINAPQGVSETQIKAIFDQQLKTGSLTGFKVGDALSAVTQAADGLESAKAALAQAGGSLTGALGAAANLNTIAASLGAGAAAAAGQVGASLKGPLAGIASLTTGASAAVNGALSGLTSQLGSVGGALSGAIGGSLGAVGGAINAATSQVTSALGSVGSSLLPVNKLNPISAVLNNPLTGAAAQVGSVASTAVATLTKAVSGGLPTAAIGAADFVKQIPAVSGIANLSAADVTGTLAAAGKMVGQLPTQISNNLGIGKFGFDVSQLEVAGMVKPGTAAAFLAEGEKDIVEVLKSPTVWTGKDGIKSLSGLVSNVNVQDKIQTGLMSAGLNAVKGAGIPVDSLTPQAVSGLATMAAKNVTDTVNFAKGLAGSIPAPPGLPQIPGKDQLAPNVTSAFNNVAKNSSFAVNLTQQKIERPVKQEVPVEPAANTVDTETQAAAAKRVVGNDKVPTVSADDGGVSAAKEKVQAFLDITKTTFAAFEAATAKVDELEKASSVTQSQIDEINAELAPARAVYNSRATGLRKEAADAVNALPPTSTTRRNLVAVYDRINDVIIPALNEYVKAFKQRLKDLAGKIAT